MKKRILVIGSGLLLVLLLGGAAFVGGQLLKEKVCTFPMGKGSALDSVPITLSIATFRESLRRNCQERP